MDCIKSFVVNRREVSSAEASSWPPSDGKTVDRLLPVVRYKEYVSICVDALDSIFCWGSSDNEDIGVAPNWNRTTMANATT